LKSWMKKWLPLLSLVVVPVALAEEAPTMDTAAQATVETATNSTPSPDQEAQREQKVEDLQHEVAALKAELANQSQSDTRQYASDVDSHPNWP
jgi:hypothetical protein